MDNVSKTLFIPLYGKALLSRRGLLLSDPRAEEIWESQGFPLKGKAASKWLAYYMAMRAMVFDRWLKARLENRPDAVVLHLGCGLDSRCCRVDAGERPWFDVDLPEVIRQRERWFPKTENYHLIAADLSRPGWLERIPGGGRAVVVMEGLSMYLTMPQLQALLGQLGGHFREVCLLMDSYTCFAARATKYKNPINQVGVTQVHGFDDPREPAEGTGFTFLAEHSLTPEDLIRELTKAEQGFFRLMYAGKIANHIYRLYEYQT